MRQFDLAPLYRNTVGFDRLFSMLDQMVGVDAAPSYPPYNIERTGENAYRISIAVAGFTPEELSVEVKDGALFVSARKAPEPANRNFLHRGIATRAFERRFALADHVQVRGADLKDGLLSVELVREIPEAMKPRKINIGGSEQPAIGKEEDQPASRRTVEAEAEHA